MELKYIYTQCLEMICMEQWVRIYIQWLSKWLGTSNNQRLRIKELHTKKSHQTLNAT